MVNYSGWKPKVLLINNVSDFAIFNFSEKLQNIFEIEFKNYMEGTKITLGKKYFEIKYFGHVLVYILN